MGEQVEKHPPGGVMQFACIPLEMNELQLVASVAVKKGFVLEITFEDRKSFPLDFKPWIDSETGWLFDPLKDPSYFAKVSVHGGALEWPNGPTVCLGVDSIGRCRGRRGILGMCCIDH